MSVFLWCSWKRETGGSRVTVDGVHVCMCVPQTALSFHASDDCPGRDQERIPALTQQIPGDQNTGK